MFTLSTVPATGILAQTPLNHFGNITRESSSSLSLQAVTSQRRLNSNLDLDGVTPGGVPASPSRSQPDYFYHWVRDGALVMNVYVDTFERSTDPVARQDAYARLTHWASFEHGLQNTPNPSGGSGEPKFNLDGTAFDRPWGRPQNDGPALRALVMARFAQALLAEGRDDLVKQVFYRAELPATSVIKNDLEFVASRWREASYDLWEEVRGRHLYTRLVQRAALLSGARLAVLMDDAPAAAHYRSEAAIIERELADHRNPTKGYLEVTLNRVEGWDHKKSGLDVAVVLGALHANGEGSGFDVDDEWVLATAEELRNLFVNMYAINRGASSPMIGRYPEDRYDGIVFTGGHAWYLTTHAFAELDCKLSEKLRSAGTLVVTERSAGFYSRALGRTLRAGTTLQNGDPDFATLLDALKRQGLSYLERSRSFASGEGSFAEQVDTNSGAPRGAPDLSWSYASFLSAFRACSALQ